MNNPEQMKHVLELDGETLGILSAIEAADEKDILGMLKAIPDLTYEEFEKFLAETTDDPGVEAIQVLSLLDAKVIKLTIKKEHARRYITEDEPKFESGKDHRYRVVQRLIESGAIVEFNQIFHYIPKSVIAEKLGVNYPRFVRLIQQPNLFRLKELEIISSFFDVEPIVMIALVLNDGKRKTPKETDPEKKEVRKRI